MLLELACNRRRLGLACRQGAYVAQRLLAGGLHHLLPFHASAQGVTLAAPLGNEAQLGAVRLLGSLLRVGRVGALLDFQDKAAMLIQVDAAGALPSPVVEGHGALQRVLVLSRIVCRGVPASARPPGRTGPAEKRS